MRALYGSANNDMNLQFSDCYGNFAFYSIMLRLWFQFCPSSSSYVNRTKRVKLGRIIDFQQIESHLRRVMKNLVKY